MLMRDVPVDSSEEYFAQMQELERRWCEEYGFCDLTESEKAELWKWLDTFNTGDYESAKAE